MELSCTAGGGGSSVIILAPCEHVLITELNTHLPMTQVLIQWNTTQQERIESDTYNSMYEDGGHRWAYTVCFKLLGSLEKTNLLYSDRKHIDADLESETGELRRKGHEVASWGDR